MDEPKLWREILFLLIPLAVMVGLAMMIGCSQNSFPSQTSKAQEFSKASDDPYAQLHANPDELEKLQ